MLPAVAGSGRFNGTENSVDTERGNARSFSLWIIFIITLGDYQDLDSGPSVLNTARKIYAPPTSVEAKLTKTNIVPGCSRQVE